MFTNIVKNVFLQNGKKLVPRQALFACKDQQQQSRGITKSTENEMNVDYMTFKEQVSPLVKDKKYNIKKAQR